jgi:hypothetical protein
MRLWSTRGPKQHRARLTQNLELGVPEFGKVAVAWRTIGLKVRNPRLVGNGDRRRSHFSLRRLQILVATKLIDRDSLEGALNDGTIKLGGFIVCQR